MNWPLICIPKIIDLYFMTIIFKIKVAIVINKVRKHHWEIIIYHENEDDNKYYVFYTLSNFNFFIKEWCKIALFSLIINTY